MIKANLDNCSGNFGICLQIARLQQQKQKQKHKPQHRYQKQHPILPFWFAFQDPIKGQLRQLRHFSNFFQKKRKNKRKWTTQCKSAHVLLPFSVSIAYLTDLKGFSNYGVHIEEESLFHVHFVECSAGWWSGSCKGWLGVSNEWGR